MFIPVFISYPSTLVNLEYSPAAQSDPISKWEKKMVYMVYEMIILMPRSIRVPETAGLLIHHGNVTLN